MAPKDRVEPLCDRYTMSLPDQVAVTGVGGNVSSPFFFDAELDGSTPTEVALTHGFALLCFAFDLQKPLIFPLFIVLKDLASASRVFLHEFLFCFFASDFLGVT